MVRKSVVLLSLAAAPLFVSAEGLNEYPTLDRVNYVMDCMDRHGGPKIEHLTACSCEMDEIGAKMSYEHFVDANVFMQNKDTPGDKGAVFRDMATGKDGFDKLEASRAEAEKVCWVTVREVKRKGEAEAATASKATAPAAN
jgi:hypothetical protein